MKKNIFSFLKIAVSISIALLLLFLVFKNVDWVDFWNKAKSVDYSWVITSIILSIVAYWARAHRWNLMLKPLGHDLQASRTMLAVLIGYLANLALPRLGEITRCGVLNRNDKVPVPDALGTVVVERIADVIVLFILIGFSLIFEYERLMFFLVDAYSEVAIPSWVWILVLLVGCLGMIGIILLTRSQRKKEGKISAILSGFINGLLALKDLKNPMGFALSTLTIWVVYYLMSYIIVFSLPETSHLDLSAGLMLLITGGIALSLPVQSGFGTYHGMIAGMLLLYGIEESTGVFLATLLHTSQIVAVALFGSVAVIISFMIRRRSGQSVSK